MLYKTIVSQKGDIIIELAGKKVSTLAEFRYELYKHSPQEEVEITFIREGKVHTNTWQLGKFVLINSSIWRYPDSKLLWETFETPSFTPM